jgi:hypothetical protein
MNFIVGKPAGANFNVDTSVQVKRHIENTPLDHPDGSVTENKLSAELKAKIANIPTDLKDLTEDETHKVVTDEQINEWNSKEDGEAVEEHDTNETAHEAKFNTKLSFTDITNALDDLDSYQTAGYYFGKYAYPNGDVADYILLVVANDVALYGKFIRQILFTNSYVMERNYFILEFIDETPVWEWTEWYYFVNSRDTYLKYDLYTKTEIEAMKAVAGGLATLNANSKVVQMPEVAKVTTIIDTPVFSIQPTITGSLDASFETSLTNYYYVTLKDTLGVALPSNQFKLTLIKDGYATAVNQIFTLTSLATGNSGTLAENSRVDFKEIGVDWKLRLHDIVQLDIPLTGNLQTKDIQVNISGMISKTYYLYVYTLGLGGIWYVSNVGNGYNTSFIFPNSSGQTKKFIMNATTLKLYRYQKEILAEYQMLHSGSDVLGGATTFTPAYSNGTAYKVNRSDINSAITALRIMGGQSSTDMCFANHTEITVKELL